MKKRLGILILTVFFLGSLFLINRDIGHFEYRDPREREFAPETAAKGIFTLGDFILLKPGLYDLTLEGLLPGRGADIFIRDDSGETIFEEEFSDPGSQKVFSFRISGPARQVRLYLGYDPACGVTRISSIHLTGDGIYFKDSVFRHLFVSCLISAFFLCCLLRILRPGAFFRLFPCLNDPRNERTLLFLLALTLIVSIPCLNPATYIRGTDTLFHLSRMKGIMADLNAGIFPPRIELFWLDDTGYGVGFYYPEIFLVPSAVLLLLGFDLLAVYKLFSLCYVFCILLSFFWSAKKIGGDRYSAGISAAIFIGFSVYRLQNQYGRDGLGESVSYIFLPLIAAGLHQLFLRKKGGWKTLALGFTGTLLSHTLSFVLALILSAIFLLFRIQTLLRNRSIAADLIKAAVLSVCLSAFFLFPMLEQKIMVPNLKINRITSGSLDLTWASDVYPFRSLWLYSKAPDPGRDTLLDVFPGWSLLAIPVLRIVLMKQLKREAEIRTADIFTAAGILTAFCSTDFFPWHLFPSFLNVIQFSWRLLQSATVLLCLAGALYIGVLCDGRDSVKLWVFQFIFCAVFAFPILLDAVQERSFPVSGFFMQNNHTYGGEYMPVELSRQYIEENKDKVPDETGKAEITNFRRGPLTIDFEFSFEEPEEGIFTVPLIYYYGYRADILTPEKTYPNLSASAGSRGFVRISTPELGSGSVHVCYRRTPVQIGSGILTILTILLFPAAGIPARYFRKRKAENSQLDA